MDHSAQLELYKINQFIKRWGKVYTFTKPGENKFGEPTGEVESVNISGVYHENDGYINQTISDAGTVVSKLNTLIFCRTKDAQKVKHGMSVIIDGEEYRVTGIRDLEKLKLACDISLEVVLK